MQIICPIISVGLFLIFTSLAAFATALFYSIRDEVNSRSSHEDQVRMFFLSGQVMAVVRRHSQLLPDSNKRRLLLAVTIASYLLGPLDLILALKCLA